MCSMISIVFFFKQKTAYEMRISDWSSDVCSSDLRRPRTRGPAGSRRRGPDMGTASLASADEAPRFYDLDEHPHPEGHSTMLGFWIYLMSDCLIFSDRTSVV